MIDARPSSTETARTAAWVTLVTRASYLPGVILLAHSLRLHESKYPLLILTTPSFPASLLPILAQEASITNALLLSIESLSPPPENRPASLIASRFEDTWTKLRVFELYKYGYEKLVFLDADMLVLRHMDELFQLDLPGRDWIAANHACVCNLDGDSWAPENWTRENCAYTGLKRQDAATTVPLSDHAEGEDAWSKPLRLLNSGMFIVTPYESQWKRMLSFLNSDNRVKHFLFPDQDFLAAFFLDRWKSVGWQYNALKTMRYWHESMWDDEEVKNVHYIVDKPWNSRVTSDGVAGYLRQDGITHSWWWKEYENWKLEREKTGETEILEMMRSVIA